MLFANMKETKKIQMYVDAAGDTTISLYPLKDFLSKIRVWRRRITRHGYKGVNCYRGWNTWRGEYLIGQSALY